MLGRFLAYTEIKTKITSIFVFLLTIAFLLYEKQRMNWELTAIFFCSMFLFDLTTTAINNYIDSKTNGQALQFKRRTALTIIAVMLFISIALGLWLAWLTGIVILLIGALCFICGILYTWGPVPISRQPLGEVLSGVFYGLFIPFIMLYINMPDGTFLSLSLSWDRVGVEFAVWPFVSLFLLAMTPMCTTANIMLANNICDVEKDVAVRRYTLPYYFGKKALYLFAALYYATYAATVVMVVLGIIPVLSLASLLTIFVVQKNINRFMERQEKATTFMTSIINYIVIMGTDTVLLFIGALVY